MTHELNKDMENFLYRNNNELLLYVGMVIQYLDLSGNVKESLLLGNGKRTWLADVACTPYADTVKVKTP